MYFIEEKDIKFDYIPHHPSSLGQQIQYFLQNIIMHGSLTAVKSK